MQPAYCRSEAYASFHGALSDIQETRGLFRAAFSIALHELPHADVTAAEQTLAELSDAVRRRVRSANQTALLAHLHDVLFDVVAFHGNERDYYNPANSYMPEVIRTRRGIPITLVLVYKCVGEQLGLTVHGINAPGHFLAAVEDAEAPNGSLLYVDPFYRGGVLTRQEAYTRIAMATGSPVEPAPGLLRKAGHRDWLRRMLLNLQAIFAHTGREKDLYAMQELQDLLT